jgi:hypothetical protein
MKQLFARFEREVKPSDGTLGAGWIDRESAWR